MLKEVRHERGAAEFRLEVFFERWEFAARHHLTASDAHTLTVGELLALSTEERRDAFERMPLTYAPTWGTPPLLDGIASTYDTVGPSTSFQRRGLPRPRAGTRAHAAAGRRPVTNRAVAQRHVEGLRPTGPADRLAGVSRPRAARASRTSQALHLDLQRGPERAPGDDRARGRGPHPRTQPGDHTENLPAFDAFAAWPEHFAWEPPQGGCVTFPRLLTGEPTGTFCRRLVETAGVLLLPADIYHSDLAEMPSDRFRLGVGRRDPLPALDALDRFLHTDR